MSNSPQAAPPPTAADICALFKVKKEAAALLQPGMSPSLFLGALMEHRQYLNAIEFMAHALPARAAIWWGCLCLQHACGENLSPPDRAALQAATVWVLWPTEAYRATAQAQGQVAGMGSPAGLLAMAASAAGLNGRIPMPPAKAVINAVKLATTKADPAKIADTQRLYVELGTGVAVGKFPWPQA